MLNTHINTQYSNKSKSIYILHRAGDNQALDDVDSIRIFIAKRSQKGYLPPNFI